MQGAQTLLISGFFILVHFLSFAQDRVVLEDAEITEDRIKGARQYSGLVSRPVDVLHMELDLELDWTRHAILGTADLYMKPFFNPVDSVFLDAQGFKLNEVAQVLGGQHEPIEYNYDGKQLRLSLKRTFTKDEVIHLHIDYVALPDSLNAKGGKAIRDAKGFYFIDETPEYGKQFWTQGEPESNSAWFPTIDKPNEKFTHKIGITVDSTWKTCSNGALEFRTQNGDGTRTDYWVMDMPHSAYLVMLGGGDMDTIGSQWNGKPTRYFVDPAWKDQAAEIFKVTHDQMTFFSDKLGVPYPWQKYDQFVAREYVSGAMENTTATVHGDFVYRDSRALQDKTAEDLIAHELFHQWFGDYVTCENWSNLPLNESFASFGELAWHEHKYDDDDVAWFLHNERQAYLREFYAGKSVPMIRPEYDEIQDMFDRHTYQRGTCVLYMLKHTVGEEAFYASLNKYLTDNALQSAELADLERAFKKVTGQDLRWFFDQWFREPGHPQLKITNNWDKENGTITMTVEQVQDIYEMPVYRLPVAIDVYSQLGHERHEVEVNKQVQTFTFDMPSKPYLIKFDADNYLLAEIEVEQSDAFWLHQLGNSEKLMDRQNAIKHLINTSNANLRSTIAGIALNDKHYSNILLGLKSASSWDEKAMKKLKGSVEKLLKSDNNKVRATAIEVWSIVYSKDDAKLYRENLNYNSYVVNEAALFALAIHKPDEALQVAKTDAKTGNKWWSPVCMQVLTAVGTSADIQDLANWAKTQDVDTRTNAYFSMLYAIERGGDVGTTCVDILTEVAKNDGDPELRYYASQLMEELAYEFDEQAKSAEKEEAKVLKEMAKYIRENLKSLE